jgi:hypothetical protein
MVLRTSDPTQFYLTKILYWHCSLYVLRHHFVIQESPDVSLSGAKSVVNRCELINKNICLCNSNSSVLNSEHSKQDATLHDYKTGQVILGKMGKE